MPTICPLGTTPCIVFEWEDLPSIIIGSIKSNANSLKREIKERIAGESTGRVRERVEKRIKYRFNDTLE